MEWNSVIYSLVGGGLVGLAATLLLLFNGRIAGISGIFASALSNPGKEELWRWFFLAGLASGGALVGHQRPELFDNHSGRSISMVLIAGLFVGYGTVMGSGCTSGHGVCGLSRFSVRSVFATLVFMFFGFLTVLFVRFLLGEQP